ncbi:MAG TPA: hypothetical protein PLV84_05020 [Deltaproteobacteria bacterium]|nr:hypothetical protein [Deltaproteobacteria bacterium]
MHIDWFVFAAQIVNFLILVALLKYFLYDRIVKAMDARQAGIAARLEEAERLKDEARARSEELEEKNRELKEKAEEVLNQANRDADAERGRLMALVSREAQQSRQRWRESLLRERQVFFEELRIKAGMFIFGTIRRIMKDLADEDLEDRMVQVFTGLVKGIDPGQQELLRRSLDSGTPMITLRSAFELKPSHREKILEAIGPYISKDVSFRYEVSDTLLTGIELMTHGYKLAWSIGDHLSALQEDFNRALREEIPEEMPGEGEHGEETR